MPAIEHPVMDIETAKSIVSKIVNILLAREGIGSFNDADITTLKQTSLVDMLTANKMMITHKEPAPNGGTISYIRTTDSSIAELYCRLHDDYYHTVTDLEDACSALNDLRDTPNGHGVLIDGYGNYSFVELNHAGDGAIETLCESFSAGGLLSEVKTLANRCGVDVHPGN
ncbi:hypothetical protein [Pseudoalteromonas sp.]|uniref:hypothetical protein n=1 Tax=Pseudoalteromonas sp. TaxID=53249 RepID=UPI00261166A1|nr:hypothetical protein [Pseudoalteromonas sp.]MCP3865163.1 hypothetical protein [Aestuariibacter sp.]MCP4588694.1 hypothetical protein [Pseudoalteromonas sp.]